MRRLYAIKRRPATQPVVLLVAGADQVREWAVITPRAEALMRRFWPGALTLVLSRRPGGPIAGAEGQTVAFRAPDHPVALELLKGLAEPIASSSANRAGRPPPDDIDAVLLELEQELDLILDGGKTPLGRASTIVDLSASEPRLIRQGVIPEQQLLGRS